MFAVISPVSPWHPFVSTWTQVSAEAGMKDTYICQRNDNSGKMSGQLNGIAYLEQKSKNTWYCSCFIQENDVRYSVCVFSLFLHKDDTYFLMTVSWNDKRVKWWLRVHYSLLCDIECMQVVFYIVYPKNVHETY